MGYKSSKRKLIIAGIFLILLTITLGFAYLTSTLKINGRAGIKENTWNIYFNDVSERCYSMNAETAAYVVENDKTKINFEISLNKPGQVYSFDAEIKNDGTIDAMIDTVTLTGIPDDLKNIISWNVEYLYGEKLQKCDELLHETTRKIRVTVEYDKDIEVLPEEQDLSLSLEIKYVQLDGNECTLIPAEEDPTIDEVCGAKTLTINPNGGVYNETESNTILLLEPYKTYEVQTPTREGYKFLYWTVDKENVYDSETNIVTMDHENITLTANWEEKYTLTINPNGGTYGKGTEEETTDTIVKEMLENDEYTLLTFEREGYELVLDLSTIEEYNSSNRKITMGTKNIEIVANWNLIDTSRYIARRGSTYYETIQAAFDDTTSTIYLVELLEDKCTGENTITESPTNNNAHALSFDMHACKVEGTLTNNGNLTLYNGTFENEEGTGAINTGTLTLGKNDDEVLVDEEGTVALIGSATEGIGLQNTGTFNFYDGYLEARVGLVGTYDDIPEDYFVYVNHNDAKNCQRVHLTQDTTRAVAKTINEGQTMLYFNLQDALNSGMEEDLDVYAIRNFEAEYTLNVPENEEVLFDLSGFEVRPGETITNSGTFTITDTGKTVVVDGENTTQKGELFTSKTITNNSTLNITNAKVTQTTDADTITNNGTLNLNGSTINAKAGYGINNIGEGTITGDSTSEVKSNSNYGLRNVSTDKLTVSGGTIYGVNNAGLIDLRTPTVVEKITNNGSYVGLYNDGNSDIIINGATINVIEDENNLSVYNLYGVLFSADKGSFVMNSGTINVKSVYSDLYGINRNEYGTVTINGGTLNVEGGTIANHRTFGIYATKFYMTGGIVSLKNPYNYSDVTILNANNYNISGGKMILDSGSTSTDPDNSYTPEVIDGGSGTISGNFEMESSHLCIYANGLTISGGKFTCGTYGISELSGNLVINDIDLTANKSAIRLFGSNYSYYDASFNIKKGKIVSNEGYAIYDANRKNSVSIIGSEEAENKVYLTGKTGLYLAETNTHINIINAEIIGKEEYGIHNNGILNIGIENDDISPSTPIIRGNSYGIYNNGETNFYNGIFKGKVAGYLNDFTGISDGANIDEGTETIDEEEYVTNYLTTSTDFVKVGTTEYNSLNKAIAAIDETGTMEIIANASVKSATTIPTGKNITLDLAGFSLDVYKSFIINGSFIVDDSSNSKTGSMTCTTETCFDITNNLEIKAGTITATFNSSKAIKYIKLAQDASFTMNGGKINVTNNALESSNTQFLINQSHSNVYINSGELSLITPNIKNILIDGSGTVTMTGGKLTSETKGYTYGIYGPTFNMSGGEINLKHTGDWIYGINNSFNITGGTINFDSSSSSSYAIYGNGTISGDTTVNSNQTCMKSSGTININGGTYNCDSYGVNLIGGGNIVMNNGTINSKSHGIIAHCSGGVSYCGKFTVNGGNIISETGDGISYGSYNANITSYIGSLSSEVPLYIEGNNGVDIWNSDCKVIINNAEIVGRTGSGVNSIGSVTVGTNNETVSSTSPLIRGQLYGLYNDNGLFNYYDGVVAGIENEGYYGAIIGLPDGYTPTNDTATYSEKEYNTNYLTPYINFVKVGETEYNSLNKAIAAIDSEGTMELIASAQIKSPISIPEGKNITLDLAGYSLEVSKQFTNNGTFTINDSSGTNQGALNCLVEKCIDNSSSLTINGGTFSSTQDKFINNTGTIIYNGGVTNLTYELTTQSYYGINNEGRGSFTNNGGTINLESKAIFSYTIYGSNYETITMNAGTINATATSTDGYTHIYGINCNNIVNFTGGTINVDSNVRSGTGIYGKILNMSGGDVLMKNISNSYDIIGIDGNFNVTGGNIVIDTLEDGYDYYLSYNRNFYRTAIWGYGTISGNVTVTTPRMCVFLSNTTTISNGTYNCGGTGIGIGKGNLNVTGGTVNSNDKGIFNIYTASGALYLTGGTIISKDNYGVSYSATSSGALVNIGVSGDGVDTGSPIIQGSTYGINIETGTNVSFYDGILKGKTGAYSGEFTNIETNTIINRETETIDGEQYEVKYLINETDIVVNLNKTENNTYTNLQTAITEATSGDNLELIGNAPVFYEITIPEEKTINLDMKGYSITTSKTITNNGILNISDTSDNKTSKINSTMIISLITNNGTLSISDADISFTSTNNDAYPLINNGISTLTKVDINSGYYGIKNTETGTLNLTESNITAENTGIYNYGGINIYKGNITGNSYGIYNSSNTNGSVEELTINSNSTAIYKYNDTSVTTLTKTDVLTGKIENKSGTLSFVKGNVKNTIKNEGTMSFDETSINRQDEEFVGNTITSSGTLTLDNVTIEETDNFNSLEVYYGAIKNTGTMTIESSDILIHRNDLPYNRYYTGRWYYVTSIYNNGGTLTLNNNTISIDDTTEGALSSNRVGLYGVVNDNGGSFTSIDDTIKLDKGGKSYGVYNLSTNSSSTIDNILIQNKYSNTTYGIINKDGAIAMTTGKIDVSAENAYGIYINGANASVTLGTNYGPGATVENVSTTNPEVKAIGTTQGIGVKKVNGSFNFYDGKLIGNTYSKPETASLSESGFESRYFLVHDDNTETEIPFGDEAGRTYKYEYSILQLLN